jgi:hypothetical protein
VLIRVFVSLVVYIPSVTEDMKFLTVHDSSLKLYSFLMNYEAFLPAFDEFTQFFMSKFYHIGH